jgi:DNA primase
VSIENQLRQYGFKGSTNSTGQFITTCPFCGKTAKFYINVKNGLYKCFRGSCQRKGKISSLIKGLSIVNDSVLKKGTLFAPKEEHKYSAEEQELSSYNKLHKYILDRGFDKQFLISNRIGYDQETCAITIPIYLDGKYLGVIRRAVLPDVTPKYSYPKELPKKSIIYAPYRMQLDLASGLYKTLYKTNDLVIVEGSLDALKCLQNGYMSVATLGCNVSKDGLERISELCSKYELNPVILFDNDEAGEDGLLNILNKQTWFSCKVARFDTLDVSCYDDSMVKKDPGELSAKELEQIIAGQKTKLQYNLMRLRGLNANTFTTQEES